MASVLYLIAASAISAAAYALLYALKRQLFPAEIVLTEGIILMAVFVPVLIAALLMLRAVRAQPAMGVAIFLIAFLSMLTFNMTVPAVVDRSVTLYLMNNMHKRGEEGMTVTEVREEFLATYFTEDYAMRKRLGEQTHTGNLEKIGDDRWRITDRGRMVMAIIRAISYVYNLDPHIVGRKEEAKN